MNSPFKACLGQKTRFPGYPFFVHFSIVFLVVCVIRQKSETWFSHSFIVRFVKRRVSDFSVFPVAPQPASNPSVPNYDLRLKKSQLCHKK